MSIYSDDIGNQPPSEIGAGLRGLHALVVDGDAALRDSLERDLASFGFLTTAVSSVQEGISTLRKAATNTPYDVVVVASQLPAISGLELCDLIRQGNIVQRAPKLILTSRSPDERHASELATGRIDAFRVLPLQTSSLLKTMRHVFAEQSASQPAGKYTPNLDIVMRLLLVGCEINDLDLETGLLHTNKDRALYELILKSFLTNNAHSEGRIRAALEAQDPATAERLAHSLKGLAATIGAKKLKRAAEQVENAIYDGLLNVVQKELQSLNVAMAALIEPLRCAVRSGEKP